MKEKLKRAIAVLLCGAVLGGCAPTLDAGALITPPKLTKEQSELYSALEKAVGSDSFKLKYPLRGDYRSAFILQDLDYDQNEEAIAFYELTVSGVTSTWMAVLVREESGWYPAVQVPGVTNEVDFIRFAHITQRERQNIIVGYAGAKGDSPVAVVYLYNDHNLPTMYTDSYNEIVTMDFDKNGLDEMVIFNLGLDRPPAIRLTGFENGRIKRISDVMLPNATKDFYQVGAGAFADGLFGVYADIMLDSRMVTTIIATVEENTMNEVFAEELGLTDSFDRKTPTPSVEDIDQDGYLELPQDTALPGYEREVEENRLNLTKYYSIEDGSFQITDYGIYNHKMGYMVKIPESWAGVVTVVPKQALNEWSFCVYNGSFGESILELLRIKAVGPGDYVDKFDTTAYELIQTRGNTQYMAYIPANLPVDLGITMEELKGSFLLL